MVTRAVLYHHHRYLEKGVEMVRCVCSLEVIRENLPDPVPGSALAGFYPSRPASVRPSVCLSACKPASLSTACRRLESILQLTIHVRGHNKGAVCSIFSCHPLIISHTTPRLSSLRDPLPPSSSFKYRIVQVQNSTESICYNI